MTAIAVARPVFRRATVAALAVAMLSPFVGVLARPPVVHAEALQDVIDSFASEVSGSATVDGVDISGELAAETAAGAVELTPAGWALDAGMAAAGAGLLIYNNRKSILAAMANVWGRMSSSERSAFVSSAKPGSSVTMPSAVNQYVDGMAFPVDYGSGVIHVPNTLAQGQPIVLVFSGSSAFHGWAGIGVWGPRGSWNVPVNQWNVQGGEPYTVGGAGRGSQYSWVVNGAGFVMNPTSYVETWKVEIEGVTAGESLNYQAFLGQVWPNSDFGTLSSSAVSSAGVPQVPSKATLANGDVAISEAVVPGPAPVVAVPTPSKSSPTFWVGSFSGGQPQPIGAASASQPGTGSSSSTGTSGNVTVHVTLGFGAFERWILGEAQGIVHWATSTVPNWVVGQIHSFEHFLSGGVTGFEKWVLGEAKGVVQWVTSTVPNWIVGQIHAFEQYNLNSLQQFEKWIGKALVPSASDVEADIKPLGAAVQGRVPFSYVSGVLKILPMWAGSVGGGCLTIPLPAYGFSGQPGNGQQQQYQWCLGSGWGSSVLALIRTLFGFMLWAFLLGWGVAMFRRLIR